MRELVTKVTARIHSFANDFSSKDCVVPENIHTPRPLHGGHYCCRPPNPLEFPFQGMFVRPRIPTWLGTPWKEYFPQKCCCAIKSNLSTTDTVGTEESGRCRGVLNKSQCMDFLSAGTKKETFGERWPIAEVRLYYILSEDDCL